MTAITITFYAANIRDVDGCDDAAAVNAVETATRDKLEAWAESKSAYVTWNRENSRDPQTFHVSIERDDDAGDWSDADEGMIREMLDAWSDEAISAGAW